jgi:hypothetical protein
LLLLVYKGSGSVQTNNNRFERRPKKRLLQIGTGSAFSDPFQEKTREPLCKMTTYNIPVVSESMFLFVDRTVPSVCLIDFKKKRLFSMDITDKEKGAGYNINNPLVFLFNDAINLPNC